MEVTTEQADGVAVVAVSGSLDADHVELLAETFDRLLADGERNFVVDLREVVVIDSAGLAQLVDLFKRVRIGPGDVRLCSLPTWVTVILAMTRLNRVFDTFPDRSAAVTSFRAAEGAPR